MTERDKTDRRENGYGRRKTDRPPPRRYRDLWLIAVTVLWVWALVSLSHQQRDANKARVEATRQRCELIDTVIATLDDFGTPRARQIRFITLAKDCHESLGHLEKETGVEAKPRPITTEKPKP